ncbi:MAG: DUF2857 family protein [Betaproteobacteria bacterium]|nr:DUF2857 family protein [Betaproteobacteria bacterium]
MAQSLQVGNPGNNARDLPGVADARASHDQFEHQIELTVDDIRPYENNPRRSANVKFDDIKESIRTGGLRSPLTVTQRPGESHFIVEAGGNTRLLALQQLWSETRDPRFRQLVVLFRPWKSESHVLTAHLIENEQRGEMSFWDKATGIVALKHRLETEQGRLLTLRPLEDALHALGLAVNTATLGLYLFATERLRTLGEAVAGLAGLDVKTLQPRLNAIKRYALARKPSSEDELYAAVFEPVFRRIADQYPHTGEFSVAATCEACEAAMAAYLGETVDTLREGLRPASARGGQGEAPAHRTEADGQAIRRRGGGAQWGTPRPRRQNRRSAAARAPSPMSWVSATVFSRRLCRPPASGSLRFQILAQQHRRGNVLGGCSQVSAARSTARRFARATPRPDLPALAGRPGRCIGHSVLGGSGMPQADASSDRRTRCRRQRGADPGGGLMLPLHDTQVRLVLLNHVTLRLADARPDELDAVGIANEQLDRLRQLSALDLNRLAAMRTLTIGIALDGEALQAGLRTVALVKEAKALEAYFIRHGASTQLMSALFKIRRKLTLKFRRDLDVRRPSGRVPLPDYATRERIYQVWRTIGDPAPRIRYYQLHQAFTHLPIAVLEVVIRDFEADA